MLALTFVNVPGLTHKLPLPEFFISFEQRLRLYNLWLRLCLKCIKWHEIYII